MDHLRYLFYKIKRMQIQEIDKFGIQLLRTISRKLANQDTEAKETNNRV